MIAKREIIFAMVTGEISNKSLRCQLCQYVDVCLTEVDEIIRKGVDGWLEPFVAWVLGLKKYIPDGFKPKKRAVIAKQRQYILGLNYDFVTDKTLHGTKKKIKYKPVRGDNDVL